MLNKKTKIMNNIENEMKEYEKKLLKKTKKEIMESSYKTMAYNECHDVIYLDLVSGRLDEHLDVLTECKNLIAYLYDEFMKTDYELIYEDLSYCLQNVLIRFENGGRI